MGVMKTAVKWTSTVNVDRENISGIDVDRQRSTFITTCRKGQWSTVDVVDVRLTFSSRPILTYFCNKINQKLTIHIQNNKKAIFQPVQHQFAC